MNNKIIIGVVVVIALVGGVFFLTKNKKVQDSSPTTSENGQESIADEFVGSLKDAITKGVSMKCTFKGNGNLSEAYIRGDELYVKSEYDGKISYMITKEGCAWTWTENEGVKICYEEEELEDNEIPEAGDVKIGNQEYNCVPTVVSDSIFEAPADIKFIDMMDLIPEGVNIPNM